MAAVPKLPRGIDSFLFQPETGRCYFYDDNLAAERPMLVRVRPDDQRVVEYFAAHGSLPVAEESILDVTPR